MNQIESPSDGELGVCQAVIASVAGAKGIGPEELSPPLYEVVDPDALDSVFTNTSGSRQAEGSVSFEFAGHPITVHSSGEIVVYST